MTEQEAIAIIKKNYPKCCKMVNGRYEGGFDDTDCELGQAFNIAIQALEEVQQYHAVGTPEECQKAVEKQIPQKPSNESLDGLNCFPICPNCHQGLNEDERESFCECGQRLDWSDEE